MHHDFLRLLLETHKETGVEEQTLALYDELVDQVSLQSRMFPPTTKNAFSESTPSEIGRYEIIEMFGKGGMGTV